MAEVEKEIKRKGLCEAYERKIEAVSLTYWEAITAPPKVRAEAAVKVLEEKL